MSEAYLREFESFAGAATAEGPEWLEPIRRAAMDRFATTGFPSARDEEWRFTPVTPIAQASWRPVGLGGTEDVAREQLTPFVFGQAEWCTLVFVNGEYAPGLSSAGSLPQGVLATSLAEALRNGGDLLQRHLARYARIEESPFTALNTAFLRDGGLIHVPAGVDLPLPINLVFVTTADAAGVVIHPRNLIVVERNARASVVESYVTLAPGVRYWTNPVTEVWAGPNSWVEHTRIQRESEAAYHVATTEVEVARDSHYRSFSMAMGASLARHNLNARLADQYSEALLYGLYITHGEQVVDTHTVLYHDHPNCRSWEVYKGILEDRSHAVFNGKVFVKPEAQKTDAKQTNRNLVLSDHAKVDTKPQLEIFADDVKCTHGATVGRLDDVALFYARSRGVPQDAAERLLTYAFAAEVIEEVALEPVRNELDRLVLERLAAAGRSGSGEEGQGWRAGMVLSRPVPTAPLSRRPAAPLDVGRIRADFPILSETVRDGHPLVYLDNAATSQKPRQVIAAISRFYSSENANIHRGLHYLSERATTAYDAAREKVARFLGAGSPSEIVFTRGTTEAINLVAQSWGRSNLRRGDEVLVTGMEHHANLVPWQLVCQQTGATFRAVPITDRGELDLDAFDRLLTDHTRLFAVGHVSNALGTVNPVRELAARARARGALVLVDGAQSAPHLAIDVSELGCDFFACSGHKLFGPTGIGVLYGRMAILDGMPPWQTGGDMLERVTLERTTWAGPPARFEAGTPPIAEVIGLAAAIDYVEGVGLGAIGEWEGGLLARATDLIGALPGVRLIGTAREKAGVLSFVLEGIHPHDVGTVLDDEGVAVRAGHHCAQPVMQRFGIPATVRASFAFYNTPDEIEVLVRGVERARKVFG